MKFLIQGIGSIGQRHYKNLQQLGHEVAVLRSSKALRPFVKDFLEAESQKGKPVLEFFDLVEAVSVFNPQALIVATPNHLHLSAALKAAEQGLHLFIEKPLHTESEGLTALIETVERKHLTSMVGYNLRFHPLLKQLHAKVTQGALGKILSASVEVGEHIADWHPWEDYRETYAPWQRSGGGSLLCFSHDIDYLFWFFGSPETIYAGGGKVTPLEGDAEDLVQGLWKYKNGLTATLHIDYWQRPKVRTFKVIGTTHTALWDANGGLNILDHESGASAQESVPAGFERNDMFLEEMKHFVACIEQAQPTGISLKEGAAVVALVERMKQAL